MRRLRISPVTGVLLGVLVALAAANLATSTQIPQGTGLKGVGILTLPFAAVGLIVARRRPRNSIGWILLAFAYAFLVSVNTANYAVLVYRVHDALPLGRLAVALAPAWILGLRYVTTLFFLGVIVQFFLVGYGLFAMKHGATIDEAKSLDAHRSFGFVLGIGGLLLFVVLSLLAWPRPRRLVGLYLLLGLLAFPTQFVLAAGGVNHRFVGMLHPVNALILLGLSGYLARWTWRASREGEPKRASAAVAGGS